MVYIHLPHVIARCKDINAEADHQYQDRNKQPAEGRCVFLQQKQDNAAQCKQAKREPCYQISASQKCSQQREPRDSVNAPLPCRADCKSHRQHCKTMKKGVVNAAVIPVKGLRRVGHQQQIQDANHSGQRTANMAGQTENFGHQAQAQGKEASEEGCGHQPGGQPVKAF